MQKKAKPPVQIPGSWNQYAQKTLARSEAAPGKGCSPATAANAVARGGAGQPVSSVNDPVQSAIPESALADSGAVRVNLAGNMIHSLITPKNVTPLERVFRRNAVEGVLTASPRRPFRFELGTIFVPKNMSFVMLDYRFSVHVPTAVPGDTAELEDRRLSTIMGFDVKFSEKRTENMKYELEPSDPSPFTDEFADSPNAGIIPGDGIGGVNESTFQQLRASSFASVAGSALSTLPQRKRRESQLDMPFTYLLNSAQRVTTEAVIFRPIPYPIAFFEAEIVGMLVGANDIEQFVKGIVTTTTM